MTQLLSSMSTTLLMSSNLIFSVKFPPATLTTEEEAKTVIVDEADSILEHGADEVVLVSCEGVILEDLLKLTDELTVAILAGNVGNCFEVGVGVTPSLGFFATDWTELDVGFGESFEKSRLTDVSVLIDDCRVTGEVC